MNNNLQNIFSQLLSDIKPTNSKESVNNFCTDFQFSQENLAKLTRIQAFWLLQIYKKLSHKSSIPNEDRLIRVTYYEFASFLENISEKQVSRHINKFVKLGLIQRYNSKDLNYPLIYCVAKKRKVKDTSYYYAIPSEEIFNKIKYQANKLKCKHRKVVPLFELKCEKTKSVRSIKEYNEVLSIIFFNGKKKEINFMKEERENVPFNVYNANERIPDIIKWKIAAELILNPALSGIIAREAEKYWIRKQIPILDTEKMYYGFAIKYLNFHKIIPVSLSGSKKEEQSYERKIPEGYRDRIINSKPFDINTLVSKNKCAPSESSAEWNARMEKLEQKRLEKLQK